MFPTVSSGRLQGLFNQSDQRRMSTALLVAVLLHVLLLSLTFGGQAFGLPGFKLPWKKSRLGADELQIMLRSLPALPAKEANPVLASEDVATIGSTVSSTSISPIATPLPMPKPAAASAPLSAVEPVVTTTVQAVTSLPVAPVAQRSPTHLSDTPTQSTARDVAQPALEQATRDRPALDQAGVERETQLAENLKRTELMAAAQREATRQAEAARAEQEKAEALRQEAARNEAIQREQVRQAQLELQRQERVRQEAVREEQVKQAEKAEKARQAAAEKQKQEEEKMRADAARQDAAKQEQEQAKRELALSEKARYEAEREERLKAIGRQLNLEAAQRDAASRAPLPSASPLRRGWLFGRADPNGDLVLYAEAMSRKIEKNMTFEMIRDVIKQAHNRPTVTIAVRADGTVEKVTFVTSSGVTAVDEAIRKIIASQAPYGAFPPSLARQYDVIEIRRTWIFDIAIRLE
jgi:outer membrane biosynthesis protein TonB